MRSILILLLVTLAFSTGRAQTGDWYINANGSRLTISIAQQGEKYVAYLDSGSGCSARMDSVTVDAGVVEWRRLLNGATQWYIAWFADGFMWGRFAHVVGNKAPKPPLSAYRYHVTGWSHDHFAQITPAVFDVQLKGYRGRLRLDRIGEQLIGRLKFYATGNSLAEKPEEDVTVKHWDGEKIIFVRTTCNQVYVGEVSGRSIAGTFTAAGITYLWQGQRAEILTYGITPKTDEQRAEWQARTRRILHRLIMAGNPAPLSVSVEILRDDLPPIASAPHFERDDNPDAHPQNYRLTEFRLTYTLPNWLGGEPIPRVVHGYLAKPTTAPPGGLEKYPLMVAVNGHSGSAYKIFDSGSLFWYGDAFARRGYMVLAIDTGHRPSADVITFGSMEDRATLLGYEATGHVDDVPNGNGYHPSIKPTSDPLSTDWEEDGERTKDLMTALDWALSRSDVDGSRVAATGLSMGGEVAGYLGALDTRIAVTIPAGYSPDLSVIKFWTNHGCWNWAFADIREYIEWSDIFALTAPRPLIVISGKLDPLFSNLPTPWTPDKQVMRRARVAGGPLVHYLHPLSHAWLSGVARGGLTYPVIIEPIAPGDLTWQANGDTASDGRTVFDYLGEWLGIH